MGSEVQQERILLEIARLPRAFKLRGFPGEYFRANPDASFIQDKVKLGDPDVVIIYLQVATGPDTWADHSKGTLREILLEMLDTSGDKRFASAEAVEKFVHGEQPDQHLLAKLEEP